MHDDCEPRDKPPGSVLGLDPETEALCRAVRDGRIRDHARAATINAQVSAELRRIGRRSPGAAKWIRKRLREDGY